MAELLKKKEQQLQQFYDPNEPRDYHGRWTTEGAGSGEGEGITDGTERPEGGTARRSYVVDTDTGRSDFESAIKEAAAAHKYGKAVEVKDSSFYHDKDNTVFLSDDKKAGAVVTSNGELVSVFKNPSSKEDITPLLAEAAGKATYGDCYDLHGYLPDLYHKFGLEPVARVAFNPELAPTGWDANTMDAPDVVMLAKGGSRVDMSKGYESAKKFIPLMTYDEARYHQARISERYLENERDKKFLEMRLTDTARSFGFEGKVTVVNEDPRWFNVGSKKFQEAAHFDPKDRSIVVNSRQVTPDFEKGLMAHETMHDKWHVTQAENEREAKEIMNLPDDEWKRLFRISGQHQSEDATAEIERRWPVSSLFGKTWGNTAAGYAKGSKDQRQQMEFEDGVSDYSRAYWNSDRTYDTKINETLAEIARLHTEGSIGKLREAPKTVRQEIAEKGYKVTKGFDGQWHVTNQDGTPVVTRSNSKLGKLIKRVNEIDPDTIRGDTKPSALWEKLYQGVNDQYDRLKNKPAPSTAEPVVKEPVEDGLSQRELKWMADHRRAQRAFEKANPDKLGIRHDADLTGEPVAEKDLTDYIKALADMQQKNLENNPKFKATGAKFGGVADFLMHEGKMFKVPDKPPQIKLGTAKECYSNSANMAIDQPDEYDYTEGLYASGHLPFPIDHAWLVNKKTGEVVDPTLGWQPTARYFGVQFPKKFLVRKLVQNKYYGLFHGEVMPNDVVFGRDKDYKYANKS